MQDEIAAAGRASASGAAEAMEVSEGILVSFCSGCLFMSWAAMYMRPRGWSIC